MYRIIKGLLNAGEIETLLALAEEAEFVDGRITAPATSPERKYNEQVRPDDEIIPQLAVILGNALRASDEFTGYSMPMHILPPYLSRYRPGMYYDRHIDAPVMGMQNKTRTDFSITVFLNPASSYDGGELIVDWEQGQQAFKLDAGDAVVYETSLVHEVAEVTRGERLAIVTWVQSMIRDPSQRRILRDLQRACGQLQEAAPDSEVLELLNAAYANLFRMWSQL
jgi:PKHD-type hydroxylase